MKCPYCNGYAELVSGRVIYPHRPDLFTKHFFNCAPCKAYVGCHPGTTQPLGRLANAELRRCKSAAHAVFDPMWRSGHMSRSDAYGWLAAKLEVPKNKCHIGMFDVDMCKKAINVCTFESLR